MNDDQKLNQNTNTASVASATQAQAQSIGSLHKEQEPKRPFIEKSDVELKIGKELEDIGVEVKSSDINLTPEHMQAGLQHAGASIPVSTAPSGKVQLPQTPKQIKTNIKKTKSTDSLRGLLLEILKNIQRLGFKEKTV